ncbi:MAG: sulfurtransferase [Hyphomicrobiales bacterium]|nr:chromate resistance protein [Ahrensia sp. AH-315-G08]PCH45162.1 MAG: sulfurtransferase [Hyphomicrobiales bacterium]
MPSPTEITVSQLSRLIGTPDCPVLVDVCVDEDFDADPRLIPSSYRHAHTKTDELAQNLLRKNCRVVVICKKGLKLGQGVAALLRDHGIAAESLQGGKLAWSEKPLPMVAEKIIPARNGEGRTLWVTRQRPKIDRIACPWLIRRFIDPNARFLFVAPLEVLNVADRFSATPFDVEDVFWSHRGETCTFDTMVEEFGLDLEPLKQLATIVRGADTDRHDLAPQAAGLLAISLGLSRMYRDDLQQLNAGMGLYDAFYRWARDAVDEGHDWPAQNGGAVTNG